MDNLNNSLLTFSVSLYGTEEKYNETISKGRCRIFYRGRNRNGSYITDEFADLLLSSIPYTPVKGIYDISEEDYTNHGEKRTEGRIYGIVPENPNLSWEDHLDEDGVSRTYACVDVLIFTALYPEAQQILEKGQSMELYPPSIKGEYKIIDGEKLYVYSEGCFLGLQILGDKVEPCFEGAAFFSLMNSLSQLSHSINIGGKSKMQINFKLSHESIYNALWNTLNVNYNEENGYVVEYSICSVYDEYAVVHAIESNEYERVYYEVDEEDNFKIKKREGCHILDVSDSELAALEALRKLNDNTFESIDSKYSSILNEKTDLESNVENLKTENSNYVLKIEECKNEISTLKTEKENFELNLNEANNALENAKKDLESLQNYKLDIELQQKNEILSKYSGRISKELYEKYTNEIANYSVADFQKELAFAFVNSNEEVIFSNETNSGFIPTGNDYQSGIEALLVKAKAKRTGGKI